MAGGSPGALPEGGALLVERFALERRLGSGSMGTVYLAHDRARDVRVALKTLRRVDASGIYRFKREFRALADVTHPNLVELYELFSQGNDWFFTMEYVDGEDFLAHVHGGARRTHDFGARRTRELRLQTEPTPGLDVLFPSPMRSPDRVRAVLRQVTRAVMALHAAGKLHRDLKPDNVLVTPAGRAVVLDFGIATERRADIHGTMEGSVLGTPAYMSPEQAAGSAVGAATDWYALGAMLYEALTGYVPFDGDYRRVLEQKQSMDPPPPSQLVSQVPDGLNTLCMRLLAREPEERPEGSEILDALGGDDAPPLRPSVDSRPAFLGRALEIAELERALRATDAGAPVVALVHGMTGMGKTALVESFLEQAIASGAVALAGRCYEHEAVPFKALDSLVDSLSHYLASLGPAEAAELLPKDVHALAQVFPVLRRVEVVRAARRRSPLAAEPRVLRYQATQALKELFARAAARQPIVAFVDDLQWGDVDSARVLAELVSGVDRPPILLVCTYRTADQERSACVSTLLALLQAVGATQVRQLEVARLSERESSELSWQLLDGAAPEHADAIARESRGSPYLLTQLVDHVRSERPDLQSGVKVSLERALSERLEKLGPAALEVLELVAASGRPIAEQVLAKLAAELDLPLALAELRRGRLVRGVGALDARAIGIYHDSIRDAVLARLPEPAQRARHAAIARALEAVDPDDHDALIDQLVGAGELGRAGLYAIGAARRALEALAFDRAAGLYEIAVVHHEDPAWRRELMAEWAEALVSAGHNIRAAEVYLEAAAYSVEPEAGHFRLLAGGQLLQCGRWARGIEVATPALAQLGLTFPRSTEEALQTAFALLPDLVKRGFDFEPKPPSAVAPAVLARLDGLFSFVQATLAGDPIACQVFAVRYLREALEAGETARIVRGLCAYFVSVDLAYSAVGRRKPESLQRAEALCQNIDDPRCHGWLALARGFAFQSVGMIKPASLDFAKAEELFRNRCRNSAAELRICQMLYARTLCMLGQFEELARCEQWIREASASDDLLVATRLRLIMVPYMLMQDDVEQAERVLEIPKELPSDTVGLTGLLHLLGSAKLGLYCSYGELLMSLAEVSNAGAQSPLLAVSVWRSDHLVTTSQHMLGATQFAPDPAALLDSVQRAISQLEELGLECHVDHVRIVRAALSYRRGRKSEALQILDTILQDADMGGESRIVRACAKLRKGTLLGGDGGAMLEREAENDLRQLGVRHPVRFAQTYAPGFY